MDENTVRNWLNERVLRESTDFLAVPWIDEEGVEFGFTLTECVQRLRAIADEAELRLANPNWPEATPGASNDN